MTDTNQAAPAPAVEPAKRSIRKPLLAGVAAALIVAAGAIGFTAYAKEPGGRHGGMMGGFMIERMLDRVDATEEQRTKINAIVEKTRDELSDLRGERQAMMMDMSAILKSPTVDRGAIEAKRAERLAKMDGVSKTISTAFGDIAEVLTPEQRKIVAALIEDRAERGGKRERGHRRQGNLDAPVSPGAEQPSAN
jgi:Spy/CpxP family protein refolding chaperone